MASGEFVGVDAHIDPRARTNLPEIFVKTVQFAGAMWASPPTKRYEDALGETKLFDEKKRGRL